MYPLANWKNLKRGFTFEQVYPNTAHWRKWGLAGKKHIGVDLIVPVGTPIYGPANGTVQQLGSTSGQLGYYVIFTADHDYSVHRAGHLNTYGKAGAVREGDIIGYSGNTGASSAPHVHYDLKLRSKYIDPEAYPFEGDDKDMVLTRVLRLQRNHETEDLPKGSVVMDLNSELWHFDPKALDYLYEIDTHPERVNNDVPDYIYTRRKAGAIVLKDGVPVFVRYK